MKRKRILYKIINMKKNTNQLKINLISDSDMKSNLETVCT